MDKYAGMNTVETRVTDNKRPARRQGGRFGFWKVLLVQTLAAAVLGVGLFAGRWLHADWQPALEENVKAAVCFDAFGAAEAWLRGE